MEKFPYRTRMNETRKAAMVGKLLSLFYARYFYTDLFPRDRAAVTCLHINLAADFGICRGVFDCGLCGYTFILSLVWSENHICHIFLSSGASGAVHQVAASRSPGSSDRVAQADRAAASRSPGSSDRASYPVR